MSGLQLLLGLSILVVLHELGHFLAARAFKTRVEKFYLFFDFLFPFPGLLNFALFKKKIGDTEYGLGWFPLGGYVKIAGMMDESMDEEQMKLPPKPDEYRSKKNWQKLIIMLGGIIMNVLVAWLIYSMMLWQNGEEHVNVDGTKYGIHCDSIGLIAGFQEGDVVLSHDGGQQFESFRSIPREMLLDNIAEISVRRNGQVTTFKVPEDFKKRAVEMGKSHGFMDYRSPNIVDSLKPGGAVVGKLQKGDRILKVDDSSAYYFHEIIDLLQNRKNKEVNVTYLRGTDTSVLKAKVSDKGTLGFGANKDSAIVYQDINYGFFQSFAVGFVKVYKTARDYLKQFKLIFSPTIKGWKQLGGVGSMASMYSGSSEDGWSWPKFWAVTAFISVVLAVMNLLPIPMLDGGYVIILLVEMAIGRPLNERVLENLQRVGFLIIIFLMVFANGNDLYKFIMHKFFGQ
ncbi:MAG: peptidase [Bacteroidetes bacterium]|nr:peptidase [Bacteroidota bacterium]